MPDQNASVSRQPANVKAPENVSASAGGNAPTNENDWLSFQEVQREEQTALGETDRQLSALCISGGGIRSATFALGALQGLAERGILENFDYLSTVSGGGYIGSWLTAWKHRWNGLTTPRERDQATVISRLDPSALPPAQPPDPVQHLREYNNYLSPKLGFFSADTWTLAATVGRNMILNWLIFVPLLMCALALPRVVLSLARLGETVDAWYVPSVGKWFDYLRSHSIVAIIGATFFAVGVLNVLRYLPGVGGKDHTQGKFLKYCFGPIFLAALALLTTDAWFTTVKFRDLFLCISFSGAAGYLAYGLIYWREVGQKFSKSNENKKKTIRWWPMLKWAFRLLFAAVLTNFSTAGGAWLLVLLLRNHLRNYYWQVYVTVAMPLLLLSFALAITVFVGLTSFVLEEEDREWLARAGAWGLLCIVCWTGLSALTLLAPKYLMEPVKTFKWLDSTLAAVGGISGLVAVLAGFSSKTKAQAGKDRTSKGKNGTSEGKGGVLLDIAGKIAAPVFIVVFLSYLAILTNWILSAVRVVDGNWRSHQLFLEHTRTEDAVLFAVILLGFSWFTALVIDINKFSLQNMYRSRLIRAYLGASNDKPKINHFTGFDPTDNRLMQELDPGKKPFHVVNIALNLVSSKRLAWQQRKAASFTVSALHCGSASDDLGYRRAAKYGGEGGISLGTAVAISGAAASPNMGYHSSPALTFIMTLFNARLGSWLGNPKHWCWSAEGPRSAFDSIIREALGLTDDTSPYVYLSDGGHFENLALYEMVRRRCRYIIVLDGGADPKYHYEDLGNALRKIRIDMKIDIEFKPAPPLPGLKQAKRCAVAEINYERIDPSLKNGYLIYIKPVVLESDPPDVIEYKASNPAFPHESTADQWFDESQTESYRRLGLCSVQKVFTHWGSDRFKGVLEDAQHYPEKPAAKAAVVGQQ